MAIKYEYTYQVTGRGQFPIDMLRYDRATPLHEADSNEIERSLQYQLSANGFTVSVKSEKPPTDGRWKSFGWRVLDPVDKRRVN